MGSSVIIPRRIKIAAIILVPVVLVIFFCFDPVTHLFPRCPFLMLTGYQCPGCGSQRAIHALLHGDVAAAWRFNAMLVAMIPVLITLAAASIWRTRAPRFYSVVNSSVVIWGVFAAVILWWIGRNVF